MLTWLQATAIALPAEEPRFFDENHSTPTTMQMGFFDGKFVFFDWKRREPPKKSWCSTKIFSRM